MSKKGRDYQVWRRAIGAWSLKRHPGRVNKLDWSDMAALKTELEAGRIFLTGSVTADARPAVVVEGEQLMLRDLMF